MSFLAYLCVLVTLGFGTVCVGEEGEDAVRLDKEGSTRRRWGSDSSTGSMTTEVL